mgnify:CR=1 FL=1
MTNKHHLGDSPTGRYTAFYYSDAENVTLYDATARMWKYMLDDTGTLDQLHEIVAGQQPDSADMMWLIETLMSVETWLEHAPHDLATYGEIGVTC